MLWPLVLLSLVSFVESSDIVAERVNLIEVNHFHDENAKPVFDQVIFYDWSPLEGRHQVRAWRLLKASEQLPTRNQRTGQYSAVWHDGDVLRRVTAEQFRETWTQHDPELAEREFLQKEKRLEFVKLTVPGVRPTTAVAPATPAAPAVPAPSILNPLSWPGALRVRPPEDPWQ